MNQAMYKMQRLLRQKRLNAVRRGIIGVIDLGSSKITCFILNFSSDKTEKGKSVDGLVVSKNLAFRVIGVATTKSRGVVFGEITMMEEVEKAIRTVVQAAQKMAGVLVEDVLVSFAGGHPKSYGLYGKSVLLGDEVSEIDVGNALANCNIPEYGVNREIIHALPVNFCLDRKSGLTNPLGQVGGLLEVDLHLITIDQNLIQNVIQCIKRCQLDLTGVTFSPYTAGIASLIEDELQLGATCIDIGGGCTGITIFLQNQLIYASNVELGGISVTKDIAQAFHISFDEAERVKNLHGGLIANTMDDREVIELPNSTLEWNTERLTITRSELIGIIRPRMEEILEEVKIQLDAAGFDKMDSQKIVLTGGSCQIPGLYDLSAKILGPSIRIARPIRLQGLPHATNGPEFASAIGLALHAGHPQDEWWDFKMPLERQGLAKFSGFFRWFINNW